MTFGERICSARVEQNLTIHEVASKLSISETTLRRYELNQLANPRYELVVACSRVLNIPLSTLMGWDAGTVEADIPVLCRNMQRSSAPMTQKAIRVFRLMLADKDNGE